MAMHQRQFVGDQARRHLVAARQARAIDDGEVCLVDFVSLEECVDRVAAGFPGASLSLPRDSSKRCALILAQRSAKRFWLLLQMRQSTSVIFVS
jgi:hypothetical protein